MPRADDPVRQAPEQRAEFEALITDISARFVNLDVGQVDHAIENTLHRLGEFLDVNRGSVTQIDDGASAVNLNEIVRPVAQMLQRLVGEKIEFVTLLEGEVGHVMVDPTLIEQVVMNLVVNARDAMAAGGTLTVRTSSASLTAQFARRHRLCGSHFVTVAVADTGSGLTPDQQARIFEPFFTTKGPGEGTGLGLATVHSIVHDAGGCVVVESTPGRGTTFTVYLPRVDALPGRPRPASSESVLQSPTAHIVEV